MPGENRSALKYELKLLPNYATILIWGNRLLVPQTAAPYCAGCSFRFSRALPVTTDPFEQTKAALARLGSQRVWSLMVTLFGDLAQSEGDAIKGPVLSAIMAAMDIRPEAVRVALHRLRNDGWIASVKQGRTSSHSLTKFGRAQSAAASARIYADPARASKDWQLAILEDSSTQTHADMLALGFAPFMPRLYVGSSEAKPVPNAATLSGGKVPGWMQAQFEPATLAHDYSALHKVLADAAYSIPSATELTPLQVAVLRCLIVHNWRRIMLKHPDLPQSLYTKDWDGHRCHVLVHELLTRYPHPSLDDIVAS